eukprot:Phypoly_transcript_23210.p1 GENE.Phypoly_transcript_23210~~Phypoly_transcript_23210.p1  ORF type:complete len:166 (-),score=6.06 Phypoly_transcript_23210:48-545(-)
MKKDTHFAERGEERPQCAAQRTMSWTLLTLKKEILLGVYPLTLLTHLLALTRTHTHSLTLTHSLTPIHSLTLTHSLTHSPPFTHSLTPIHSLTLTLTHSHSRSITHTQSLTLNYSYYSSSRTLTLSAACSLPVLAFLYTPFICSQMSNFSLKKDKQNFWSSFRPM